MEILILLLLILINGLFVMSEIALVSARKGRLESLSNKGDLKAKAALHLTENPDKFLSTAQIGITLISILTGVYSGEKFSEDLKPYLEKIEFFFLENPDELEKAVSKGILTEFNQGKQQSGESRAPKFALEISKAREDAMKKEELNL
jgi:hypothetical protein